MTRYVTLFGITPAAWAKLAPDPEDRGKALGERLGLLGVRLVDLYQAFGGTYDGVALYEAVDAVAVDGAALALGAVGPGRELRTIRLAPGEHQRDALRRVAALVAAGPTVGAAAPLAAAQEVR